jgi:hypothetical protein
MRVRGILFLFIAALCLNAYAVNPADGFVYREGSKLWKQGTLRQKSQFASWYLH